MTEKIVRCPYCEVKCNFREMVSHLDGRFICRKCGHMAKPADPSFKCSCPKCRELSFRVHLGSASVS